MALKINSLLISFSCVFILKDVTHPRWRSSQTSPQTVFLVCWVTTARSLTLVVCEEPPHYACGEINNGVEFIIIIIIITS